MKKLKLLGLFGVLISGVLMFQASAPPPLTAIIDPRVRSLEQTPPGITGIKVQKLQSPIAGNTMIMRINVDSSVCYEFIPDSLNVFYDSVRSLTFKDNGVFPDLTAGDGQFATLVAENVANFRSAVDSRLTNMAAAGKFLSFTGHSGVWRTDIPTFDFVRFDAFLEVTLSTTLVSYIRGCGLDKARSLFITDLRVVEDPARTFNVTGAGSGNPLGVWTFGHMVRGICGDYTPLLPFPSYVIAPKDLLKSWVANWTYLTHQINGQDVYERDNVYQLLIKPWLIRAGVSVPVPLDHYNWQTYWDMANEEELLKWAPFKLTAIVNRIDIRGNTSYARTVSNAGETRFIFSLVGYDGRPVKHPDPGGGDLIDWEGLNVIFEYGNVQTNSCAVKRFGQQWADLSFLPLGSPAYNTALEQITRTVTVANAGGPSKINGSALNQVRTNEKIFEFASRFGRSGFPKRGKWEDNEWEFRQFELNSVTHELEQVVLTNTPDETAAYAVNLESAINGTMTPRPTPSVPYFFDPTASLQQVVFNPFIKSSILRGNVNLPVLNPFTSNPLLAPTGWVRGEFSHFLDFVSVDFPPLSYTPTEYAEYDEVRHQVSLNTCQGCHNGETKTLFTHVAALGYGDTADYSDTYPSYQERYLDTRGFAGLTPPAIINDANVPVNGGQTEVSPGVWVSNYIVKTDKAYYQKLSAFLTGRSYTGLSGTPGSFADDYTGDDPEDSGLEGLYYVYDPANNSGTPFPKGNVFGYNDLQRRLDDLCLLINSECNLSILNLGAKINFVPLPLGGH